MAKFSVSAVERLDYSFIGFPRDDGNGYCTGKGTIPEPSQAQLDEYFEALGEIGGEDSLESLANADARESREQLEKLLDIVATLCSGTPSQEELSQLPPRIKIAFIRWIGQEFSNPEVSSAAIRR